MQPATTTAQPTFKTVQAAADKAFWVYVEAEKKMPRPEACKLAFQVLIEGMYHEPDAQRE